MYADYDYPASTIPVDTTILAVIALFLAWATLYFSLVIFWPRPQRCAEWHCRMVTVVHATIVVSMSAWCGFVQGPWPFTHPSGPNTTLQHWTIMICVAYFLFDFTWCLYYKTEGAVMMFHHVVSLFGQFLCLYRGCYGTEMIATIFGTEITNPLLQLRWFLRESGLQHTWYAEVTDLAFMLMFSVFRIGLASYLLYAYLLHPRPDWIGKAGGATIYSIGCVFWLFIIRYAIRKYTKMYLKFRGGKSTSKKELPDSESEGEQQSLINETIPEMEYPSENGGEDCRPNGGGDCKLNGGGDYKSSGGRRGIVVGGGGGGGDSMPNWEGGGDCKLGAGRPIGGLSIGNKGYINGVHKRR